MTRSGLFMAAIGLIFLSSCGGGGSTSNTCAEWSEVALHESSLAGNPALCARFDHVTLFQLEPSSAAGGVDTASSGADEANYHVAEDSVITLRLQDTMCDTITASLLDKNGSTVITVSTGQTATGSLSAGRYRLSLSWSGCVPQAPFFVHDTSSLAGRATATAKTAREILLETGACVGCELRGANLSSANLRNANLRKAMLEEANLSYAQLQSADLSFTSMTKANLSDAWLISATLRSADLHNASVSNAYLNSAGFQWANLQGARITGSDLMQTDFTHADLTGATLLDSYIDSSTNFTDANLSGAVWKDGTVCSEASMGACGQTAS